MLISNNGAIPSTSTKLNFYLAQISKNNHNTNSNLSYGHNSQSSRSANHNNVDRLQISNINSTSPKSSKLGFVLNAPSQVSLGSNIFENKQSQQNYEKENFPVCDNRSFLSVQGLENKNTLSPNPRYQNDSLDYLLTDREYSNIDTLVLSPKHQINKSQRSQLSFQNQSMQNNIFSNKNNNFPTKNSQLFANNLQYFDHHKNQPQFKPRKTVRWKVQTRNKQKRNSRNADMDYSFRQIANQISKLTQELNSNSRRLEQMNKLYKSVNKSNPQQDIKRANFKYAVVDVSQTHSGIGIKNRPYVEYEDKIYRDPRYLIWQPIHSPNHSSIHS